MPKDFAAAAKWYEMSAKSGFGPAMNSLGYCYSTGRGLSKDLTKGTEWFWKGAQVNNANAMFNLSACYFAGQGVPKNHSLAASWLKKSADAGCNEAKQQLARFAKSTSRNRNLELAGGVLAAGVVVAAIATLSSFDVGESTNPPPSDFGLGDPYYEVRRANKEHADWERKQLDEGWQRLTTP